MNNDTILMVEDELRIRQFLRVAFESEGCKVFEAATVANGLALAGDCQPNLVVLDLGLPDADGLDFIRPEPKVKTTAFRRSDLSAIL